MTHTPLTLVDFTVSRSGLPLFETLSLTLNSGEMCEIWGENGMGKTSLLESLAGLHNDFQGTMDLPSVPHYISTKAPYDGSESVENNLLFWKNLWNTPDLVFKNAVDFWYVNSLLKLPYQSLSDGQKQRANLSRLSLKPSSIWLLDEPTHQLDDKGCELFFKMLRAHLRGGGMALIATHQGTGLESQKMTLQYPQIFLKRDAS